jgi:hypothetical protein
LINQKRLDVCAGLLFGDFKEIAEAEAVVKRVGRAVRQGHIPHRAKPVHVAEDYGFVSEFQ